MSEEKRSSDPRFSGIYDDPKFKRSGRKNFKVKLDDRFGKSDLESQRKSKVDKYGRKIKHSDKSQDLKDFDKYFETNDDKKNSDDEKDAATDATVKVVDRARGEVPSDYVSSSDEYTSSESEDSDSGLESEGESEIELGDEKPESGESSKTLAIVNLDWDHVKSSDLWVTFSSFVPEQGKIKKICVYPSEFGKERMQREEVEGPPKELFNKKSNKKNRKSRSKDNSDSDDSDIDIRDLYEEGDAEKEVDSKALRQYQLERLRYYYAVVYCNNVRTAEAIYNNCDGTEYESTANIIDIRYVPDEMTFDDEPRDECSENPKTYTPLQFSTDALQHSNVKLTWDETPADRVEFAKKAFTQKEIEDMDFKAYLASESDESEAEPDEATKSKLKSLVGLSMKVGDKSIMDAKDKEDEVDMEITFTPALAGEQENNDAESNNEETTIEKLRRKEKERRKARKQKVKELKKSSSEQKRSRLNSGKNKEDDEDADGKKAKSKAELELLMMEDGSEGSALNSEAHFNMNEIIRSEKEKGKKSKYQDKKKIVEDEFKPDLSDSRFSEMFEDHAFAIDPTQSEFKDTKAMKEILKERAKRSKKEHSSHSSKKRKHNDKDVSKNDDSISNLVTKLKKKGNKHQH